MGERERYPGRHISVHGTCPLHSTIMIARGAVTYRHRIPGTWCRAIGSAVKNAHGVIFRPFER